MKPTIQLRLGQHLTMTPQLQQAIRLLQLPVMELQTQILDALEQNIMLEAEEPVASEAPESGDSNENQEAAAEPEVEAVEDSDWDEAQRAGPAEAPRSSDPGTSFEHEFG